MRQVSPELPFENTKVRPVIYQVINLCTQQLKQFFHERILPVKF